MENEKPTLPPMTIFLMVFTAVAFDLINGGINLIPMLGQVLSVAIAFVGMATFALWFNLKGYPFTKDWKRAGSFFGLNLIEVVPLLNALPATTASVIVTILMIKLEEKAKAFLPKPKGGDGEEDGEETGQEENHERENTDS